MMIPIQVKRATNKYLAISPKYAKKIIAKMAPILYSMCHWLLQFHDMLELLTARIRGSVFLHLFIVKMPFDNCKWPSMQLKQLILKWITGGEKKHATKKSSYIPLCYLTKLLIVTFWKHRVNIKLKRNRTAKPQSPLESLWSCGNCKSLTHMLTLNNSYFI